MQNCIYSLLESIWPRAGEGGGGDRSREKEAFVTVGKEVVRPPKGGRRWALVDSRLSHLRPKEVAPRRRCRPLPR
jgi:hypothetical protein